MRPGLITQTQPSGAPLPLPMRVSAGLCVTGLSGKTRIQTLPPRLMKRVMATRPASIWRFVIQAAPVDWRPQAPNATSAPRVAWPARHPFIILRYLTLFGLSMACPSFPLRLRGGAGLGPEELLHPPEDPDLDADDPV